MKMSLQGTRARSFMHARKAPDSFLQAAAQADTHIMSTSGVSPSVPSLTFYKDASCCWIITTPGLHLAGSAELLGCLECVFT
jgi:hypothetical protein